jgi:hypothetical protein
LQSFFNNPSSKIHDEKSSSSPLILLLFLPSTFKNQTSRLFAAAARSQSPSRVYAKIT